MTVFPARSGTLGDHLATRISSALETTIRTVMGGYLGCLQFTTPPFRPPSTPSCEEGQCL